MKKLLILAFVASLSACATTAGTASPTPLQRADMAIDRVEFTYQITKPFAELTASRWPAWSDRIHAAMETIEASIAAARAASTIAEKQTELKKAEPAMATITAAKPTAPPATVVPSPQ